MECADLKILVACECSQTVCAAFRDAGCEAYSCDLAVEYGGHPDWHILGDALAVLHAPCAFHTRDGQAHAVDKWDLIIAHPPCTYLSNAQNLYYNAEKFGAERVQKRMARRDEAVKFFMQFTKAGVPTVIENPPGYMNAYYRPATQTIQPYFLATTRRRLHAYGCSAASLNCRKWVKYQSRRRTGCRIQTQWENGITKQAFYLKKIGRG